MRRVGRDVSGRHEPDGRSGDGTEPAVRDEEARSRARAFHAEVAHELRGALSGVAANLELLADPSGGALSAEQQSCVHAIDVGVRRLRELVDDVLMATAIDHGSVELEIRPLDIGEVVSLAVDEIRPRCDRARQRLDVRLADGLPRALADRTSVRRVLANLLGNAHHYTPEGGSIRVSVRRDASGEGVLVAIADSGIGLTADESQHVGERFYRSDRSRSMCSVGSGLGLHISRALVEMQGGHLWLDGERDRGTVAHVLLPSADGGEHAGPRSVPLGASG